MISFDASFEMPIDLPLAEEHGVEVWMKRDDLIHPFVSGNKWRKLRPVFDLARQKGTRTLVSFGGPYSNHLLALAAAAPLYGMSSRGIVRGEEVHNPVLKLCTLFGMELQFMDRAAFRDQRNKTQLHFEGTTCHIPEGANCPEGREGMQGLWKELSGTYTHLMDSVGSGTSVRGLAASKPDGVRLMGIMAAKDEMLAVQLRKEGIDVFEDYARGGFAKTDEALEQACRVLASTTGILLDPVYTGKQWMALLDLVEKGHFKRGSKILFVHSGGLSGWLGTTYSHSREPQRSL